MQLASSTGQACLDIRRGMRQTGGRQALYWTLLGLFGQHHAGTIAMLRQLLGEGDLLAAQRLAHTLRGSAAQIGAATVEGHAALLEDALRNAAPAGVANLLVNLEQSLSSLLDLLNAQAPDFRALAQWPSDHDRP